MGCNGQRERCWMHRGPEPQWRSSAAPRQALRASPPPCSSCMALAWIDRSACVPPPRANAVGPAGPGLCLPHLVCGVHRGRGGACHGCASAAPLHRLTTLPPLLLLPTSQRAGERSMTLPCLSARACPPHPRSEHRLACTPQLRRAARQLDAPGSSRSAVSSAEREGSGFFMDLILEEELPPGSTA